MKNVIKCDKCENETPANRFVCLHCGEPLADQPDVKKHRKPALVFKRLTFLFMFIAFLLGVLAYHSQSELSLRLFLICSGLVVLGIAQRNLLEGKTHATRSTLYRDKNPTAFWIITVIYYLVGSVSVLGGVWLLI